MYSIMLLDDEEYVLKSLSRLFASDAYGISRFQDPMEALIQCSVREFDLIISDQRMPGMTGTEFFGEIAKLYPESRRLLLSGYSDFEAVTEAFNDNVIHKFVVKPWDNEQLKALVEDQLALKNSGDQGTVGFSTLTPDVASKRPNDDEAFHGIVTADPAMQQQLAIIDKTASSEAPFFIYGETGTGKELVARAIHHASDRNELTFIALNCANLTETLLESQLFGHKKGAFTGADRDQKGVLAEAEKGTLFLDEVTTIPIALQAKLLRVLQEREYTPVGATKAISFDVKIISASSTSLEQAVAAGEFREDLRYRLEVLPINLPPLRARDADKGILFDYFLENQLARHGHEVMSVDEDVYSCVYNYSWPGNVRELVNVCTYIAALANIGDTTVSLDKLPPNLRAPVNSAKQLQEMNAASSSRNESKPEMAQKITSDSLQEAINQYNGHRESIAKHFGISRMTLWRKMKDFNLI